MSSGRTGSDQNTQQRKPLPCPSVHFCQNSFANAPTPNGNFNRNKPINPAIKNPFFLKHQIPRPVTPAREILEPSPKIIDDKESGKYAMRCVCGNQEPEGLIIQCEKCRYWLHAYCVCIAKDSSSDHFLCPFCKNRPIRCTCNQPTKYDEPIVQCKKCKYWVHKSCAGIGYGKIPTIFCCSACGSDDFAIPFARVEPTTQVPDQICPIQCDKSELLDQIPRGHFRNFIIADIAKPELRLYDTVCRYFNGFITAIFEEDPKFWAIFIGIMQQMLGCGPQTILDIIDRLAAQTIYHPPTPPQLFVALSRFSISERAEMCLQRISIKKIDRWAKPIELKYENSAVRVSSEVNEGDFICDVPGLLCHYCDMAADEGLMLDWISIPFTDFVIDTSQTSFTLCDKIQRSFHYNCQPKIVKIKGDVRVALFGHRLKGPYLNAGGKGPAIKKGEPIILPLDSDLPYPVAGPDWIETKKRKIERKSASLLSLFCEDEVVQLPITVVESKGDGGR